VIIGTLVVLQENPPAAGELDKFVEPALQSARRGAQLIKRLLTFSRQHPLEPVLVDVAQMIGDMGTLIRRSLPDAIAVSTDLPAGAIDCLVDPAQLESALLNFVMNARDAMPEGGRLHISARPVELRDEAAAFAVLPGSYAMIEVADSGCGMDAATVARAYEPFFTTKRFGRGSGLGLSMAYGLVKQSGGGIALQSQPGQGTTVRLVLPLARGVDAARPLPDAAPPHAGELVLLVEDEEDVRRVVRQQLIDLGYPVIEAANGAEALQLVAQVAAIAIVLCDVVMPGEFDGAQLARRIKASHPRLRVLLMSGYSADAATALPGDPPLLTKPFMRQELARALQLAGKGIH
jgi:CheY-like chemotaxis protein